MDAQTEYLIIFDGDEETKSLFKQVILGIDAGMSGKILRDGNNIYNFHDAAEYKNIPGANLYIILTNDIHKVPKYTKKITYDVQKIIVITQQTTPELEHCLSIIDVHFPSIGNDFINRNFQLFLEVGITKIDLLSILRSKNYSRKSSELDPPTTKYFHQPQVGTMVMEDQLHIATEADKQNISLGIRSMIASKIAELPNIQVAVAKDHDLGFNTALGDFTRNPLLGEFVDVKQERTFDCQWEKIFNFTNGDLKTMLNILAIGAQGLTSLLQEHSLKYFKGKLADLAMVIPNTERSTACFFKVEGKIYYHQTVLFNACGFNSEYCVIKNKKVELISFDEYSKNRSALSDFISCSLVCDLDGKVDYFHIRAHQLPAQYLIMREAIISQKLYHETPSQITPLGLYCLIKQDSSLLNDQAADIVRGSIANNTERWIKECLQEIEVVAALSRHYSTPLDKAILQSLDTFYQEFEQSDRVWFEVPL